MRARVDYSEVRASASNRRPAASFRLGGRAGSAGRRRETAPTTRAAEPTAGLAARSAAARAARAADDAAVGVALGVVAVVNETSVTEKLATQSAVTPSVGTVRFHPMSFSAVGSSVASGLPSSGC